MSNLDWVDDFVPSLDGIRLKEWRMIHGHPVNIGGGSGGGGGGGSGKGKGEGFSHSKLTPEAANAVTAHVHKRNAIADRRAKGEDIGNAMENHMREFRSLAKKHGISPGELHGIVKSHPENKTDW